MPEEAATPAYTDRGPLRELVRAMTGRRAWSPKLGIGSFLTLEIGAPVGSTPTPTPTAAAPGAPAPAPAPASGATHGEFHLWLYCCAWRLDHGIDLLCGSEDDRDRIAAAIGRLEGRTVTAAEVSDGLDLTVTFDDGAVLRAFPIFTEGYEHWMVFAPNGFVYAAGPGSGWTAEPQSGAS